MYRFVYGANEIGFVLVPRGVISTGAGSFPPPSDRSGETGRRVSRHPNDIKNEFTVAERFLPSFYF